MIYPKALEEVIEYYKKIGENNSGLIPTYKIVFEMNEDGSKLYFKNSEFIKESIKESTSSPALLWISPSLPPFSNAALQFELPISISKFATGITLYKFAKIDIFILNTTL